MPIPSDAHVPGDTGHVTDHNAIADTLTALTATVTQLDTRYERVFSPIAYGADPTGATDSTSAVQAAINAAGVTGGTVYVPDGNYKISATLTISSPQVTVTGQNQNSSGRAAGGTSFTATSTFTGTDVFHITASEVTLAGFTVNSANSTATTGISATSAGGLTMKNVLIYNCGGLTLNTVDRSLFEDVTVQGCNSTYGFYGLNCTIVEFNRCFSAAITAATACWYFSGCETIVSTLCEANNNPTYGLYVYNSADSLFANFATNGASVYQYYINTCTDIMFTQIYAEIPSPTQVYIEASSIIQFQGGWLGAATSSTIIIDGATVACHDIIFNGLYITVNSVTAPPIKITNYVYNVTVTGCSVSAYSASTGAWISDASLYQNRTMAYTSNVINNLAAASIATLNSSGSVALSGNAGSTLADDLPLTQLDARYAPLASQTAVKTTAYTASANQVVPVDTTSGNVTVTLPAAPPAGTMVAVKQVTLGTGNTVTVACGGTDVYNKAGGGTSMTLTLQAQGVILQYNNGIWMVIADDLPLTQLDLRYAPLASPALTGTPTAPTATALTSSTQLATTAYADTATGVEKTRALAAEALLAPKASPALTGTPTAPTATALTSNTQLATTAYADAAVTASRPLTTEYTYYVSAASSASDSNDGLTVKSAKATIAGALTALGSSAGLIQLGAGTFTISSADSHGNAVTLANSAVILRGTGKYNTTITVNTPVTWGIQCQAAGCQVQDLELLCGSSGTCTYGIGVDTPASTGSAEACLFQNLYVSAGTGAMTNAYAVGPTWTSSSAIDIAETYFSHCWASTVSGAGFFVGNGTAANIVNTYMASCTAMGALYGVYAWSSNFGWVNGTLQRNGTDVYLYGNPASGPYAVASVRSENSGQLLAAQSGVGGQATVTLSDVTWQGIGAAGSYTPPAAGDLIDFGYAGALNLNNVVLQVATGAPNNPVPFIWIKQPSTARAQTVNVNGLMMATALTQAFVCSATAPASVNLTGYTQLNPATNYSDASVQPTQGAVTLLPTSTTVSINGTSRAVMRQPVVATVTNPDVQLFTASGTWTKPALAKTTFAAVLGGGGGGGAGASGTSGTVQCGGGGAAGALPAQRQFITSDLPGTVTVTVGAGGTGGASVTGMSSPRGPETCGITNGSTTVTDASCIAGDVQRTVTGTGIPVNASITAVNAGVSFTLSAAATATNASASLTIGAHTYGLAGANGATSSFGTYLQSITGSPGSGGTTLTGAGGAGGYGVAGGNVSGGSAASTTGGVGATPNASLIGAPGGPSGGGITAAAAASAGVVGQVSRLAGDATAGSAGAVGGASPGSGTASALTNGSCGPSAGSGAASTTAAAQAGANALANTGAGGAGGGASLNTFASGAGGNGGSGWVLVVSYFQ